MYVMNEMAADNNSKIRKLDIKGKVCPMTFVYTKLTLEKMNKGEILEVELDYPAAVENIPASCRQQNLGEILDIKEIDSEKRKWLIKIIKI